MKRTMSAAGLSTLLLLSVCLAEATAQNVEVLQDAFSPSWSPDGTELVCCRPTAGSYGDEDIKIWRVSSSGSDATLLIDDPVGAFSPLWLQDGSRVAYLRQGPEFVVFDLLGGPSSVWPVSGLWDDPGICLTPDGDEILYSVYGFRGGETWALDISDGTTRFVWPAKGGVISPDGAWIAYATESDSIAVAPLGGRPVRVFELGTLPRWTPDSEFLVFTGIGASGNPDLIMVSRDGSGRWELTADPLTDWNGALSPDGSQVAYYRSEAGDMAPFDLWVLDLGTPGPVEDATWGRVKSLYR